MSENTHKRSNNEVINDVSYFTSRKKQVFGRATYDTTAKYVFADEDARLDFIKTFTGINNITSTESLDVSLNPIHRLTNVRELLSDTSIQKFMTWVKNTPQNYKVIEGKDIEIQAGTKFIRELSKSFDDLVDAFPRERSSQIDILCRLSNGEYALVEIQVLKQDYWDERALAYIASIYGNQLQAGDKWKNLKKVIGINILGGGPKNIRYWGRQKKPFRHYVVQDKYDSNHIIKSLELIQYSLGDVNLDDEEIKNNKNLKDWLDYFKNAHIKDKIPDDVSNGLKKAYERIMIEKMPDDIKKGYTVESEFFENLTEHEERIKEQGKHEALIQVVKNMIQQNLSFDSIYQFTGLSIEEIKNLSFQLQIK